jgi:hypothetical protein
MWKSCPEFSYTLYRLSSDEIALCDDDQVDVMECDDIRNFGSGAQDVNCRIIPQAQVRTVRTMPLTSICVVVVCCNSHSLKISIQLCNVFKETIGLWDLIYF